MVQQLYTCQDLAKVGETVLFIFIIIIKTLAFYHDIQIVHDIIKNKSIEPNTVASHWEEVCMKSDKIKKRNVIVCQMTFTTRAMKWLLGWNCCFAMFAQDW